MTIAVLLSATTFLSVLALVISVLSFLNAKASFEIIARIASAEEKAADPVDTDDWRKRVL